MASSNPSWSLLPFDLVENILYKVPVESLVRLKSTCKQWYALLNDKRFIYKHLELSREGLIRVHDRKSCQFINLETLALSCLQGPSNIYSMIHCDGLLLCQFQHIFRPLAVWNPFLSQIKWIEPSSSYRGRDKYGFGYDNVSRGNYKILKYCQMPGHVKVEIYEFKTQLWRSVDYSCAYSWNAWNNQAVSMNGNMYWLATTYDNDYSIQCFDFFREVFKVICCVTFIDVIGWILPSLSSFGGDRLSLLARHNGKIQVWVTNNVTDEVVSWSLYFSVTPPDLSILSGQYMIDFPMYFIHKSNRIMLRFEVEDDQNENTYVNVYEIGKGVVKKQVETGRHGWFDHCHLFSYIFVPSLVPVPE